MAGIRRDDQRWIADQMFRIAGHDLLFPGALAFRLERGYRYAETKRTLDRITTFRQNAREWARTADQLAERAREAEARGHNITARDFWYRAALYYGRGQWSILRDVPEKLRLYDLCVDAYQHMIDLGDGSIERVQLDLDGETVYAILHLPPNAIGPVPCAMFFPGMDMFKEEFPNVGNNEFAKRGMAVLSVDGPGQGETRTRGCAVTDAKYIRAAQRAIDYLETRPEIDAAKIAVTGASFGSYWGPQVAAADPRVKVCAGIMGVLYSMKPIFEQAPPSFKHNFMYMAGMEDEGEFDRLAAGMGLHDVGARLTCPTLITQGENDLICPVEGAERFFEEIKGPKEMWIFENEFHPLGGVMAELIPWLVDWIDDAFAGRIAPDHARRIQFAPL